MTEWINLGRGRFLDSDGGEHPVLVLYDSDGAECDPPDAVCAVAGEEGRYFVLDLSEFGAGAFQ